MTIKIEIELKCTKCDKFVRIPASMKFPRHRAIRSAFGHSAYAAFSREDCAGSGVDSTARAIAFAEEWAKNKRAFASRTDAEIEKMRTDSAHAIEYADAYEALASKLRARSK